MEALRAQFRALCSCRARRTSQEKANSDFITARACEASALEAAIGAESYEAATSMPLRQKPLDKVRCVRCGRMESKPSYCEVVVRSIYDGVPPCQHGPYCSRCQKRLRGMTLPTCVCRAMISTWPAYQQCSVNQMA
mmetsp:Transcript_46249/g.84688  ORF Transcript_46249/g.84688 Transcript_46249/m.84688 type:complete len:136 (+) Transcript_46249:228-635(+)